MAKLDRIQSELENAPRRKRSAEAASADSESQQIDIGLNPRQQAVLRMQQTHGNQAVRRMLAQRSYGAEGGPIEDQISSQINSARGSGPTLDQGVAAKMESSMGTDFSDVHVHTDAQSDTLNRTLNAKAFTTGQDIFFQQGAYQPSSSEGQQLLAHELTHVVQQSGSSPSSSLTLGAAGDSYEQEADSVAQQAMSAPSAESSVQREEMPEEEQEEVQRQMIQREEMPEEEQEE